MIDQEETALTAPQALTLYRVGKMVAASLDLDETLGAIVDAARQLGRAELTAVLLYDEEGRLVIRTGCGAMASAAGERVPAEAGIVGQALREGRLVLLPDLLDVTHRARPDLDALSGVRAYLAAPLVWRGERLGAVTVGATKPYAFTPVDAALVAELAELAAAAVAHARAFAEEQWLRAESQEIVRQLAEQTEQLERAQRQLVQNEKLTAIGQLAQGIAHEMNTPLGIIISNLAVLQQYSAGLTAVAQVAQDATRRLRGGDAPSAVVEALEASQRAIDLAYLLDDLPQLVDESTRSAERVAGIVRSLAVFARGDADRPSSVDVEAAIESALVLTANAIKNRGQVERQFAGVPPVPGRASELTQVFVHLLLNAAEALEGRQGTITVATSSDGQDVVATVSDTGCGILPENLPRVLDPFFTTRPPGQGTGLGLSVCHGIVTRHGGSLRITSTPGQGTTVTVRLPLDRPQVEVTRQ